MIARRFNERNKYHQAIAYEIETEGHTFQIFLMSGRWFIEQHLIARNDLDFSKGDISLGFKVNWMISRNNK